MTMRPRAPLSSRQRGISLLPVLLFLLIMAVLGLSALSSGVMEERMVGNAKDMNLAFQAAEAGLRDAESDIAVNITTATAFTSACTNGLCTPPSTWAPPTSADISRAVDWSNPALIRGYGAYTSAAALPDVASQPVYVIERLPSLPITPGGSVGLGLAPPGAGGTAYRITVLATGARPETRVTLQSTFVMRQS